MMDPNQRKINLKAILIGFLVDVGGSLIIGILFGIILVIIFAISQTKQGVPLNQINVENFLKTPIFYLVCLIIGLGFSTFGGYITGKIAKKEEILNATIMGIISFLTALPFIGKAPAWYDVFGYSLTIPVAILGGHIAYKTKKLG